MYKWPKMRKTTSENIASIDTGFPGGSYSKASACNARDPGPIPGSGRSPGEGNSTHSSILTWEIPWTEEPVGLQSMGSQTWKRCATSLVIM